LWHLRLRPEAISPNMPRKSIERNTINFHPDELLKAALAKERLYTESVPDVARRILNPANRADE
jgi:hypothetical protein